jgi:hypothetical protein
LVLEDGADVTASPAPFWVHTATPVLSYCIAVEPARKAPCLQLWIDDVDHHADPSVRWGGAVGRRVAGGIGRRECEQKRGEQERLSGPCTLDGADENVLAAIGDRRQFPRPTSVMS